MEPVGGRSVGMSVKRVEDPRILSGRGKYLDDVTLPGMLHAAFLRSAVPHGRLLSVDACEARDLPGVVAVYTGEDLKGLTEPVVGGAVSGFNMIPGMALPTFYTLATDKVRHVGDPIALVVAESRRVAEDAAELVVEDIDMLDAVVTYADAVDPDKPVLHEELGDNVNLSMPTSFGDIEAAFAKADRVVRAGIEVHRHAPVPMEGRGVDRRLGCRCRPPDAPRHDPVAPHVPHGPARPDRGPDGRHPGADRRCGGRLRAQEQRRSARRWRSPRRPRTSGARSSGWRTASSTWPRPARPARRRPTSRPR